MRLKYEPSSESFSIAAGQVCTVEVLGLRVEGVELTVKGLG